VRLVTIHIDHQSESFPARHKVRSGTLATSWNELLWSALTVGRPSTYHVFRHGPSSFHEAVFRLSLVRLAVEQDWGGRLKRTDALAALDPTEKGMVGYFLGMTLCKLFASRLLLTPWLLHLDVFRSALNPSTLGRSRPDLVGQNLSGQWHAFECKGRSSTPSTSDKVKAKTQAQRLVSVGGHTCSLHVGSFAYFRAETLEFYWRDPEPSPTKAIELPEPDREWRYYYEPAMKMAVAAESDAMEVERRMTDVDVSIHPAVYELLTQGLWARARKAAMERRTELQAEKYQPDGLRVEVGDSWSRPYHPSELRQ
jgi:hypothetical protein